MFVYGDITTDARVQRSATALSVDFDVTVISVNFGKILPCFPFKNILFGNGYSTSSYLNCIFSAIKYIKKEKPDIIYGHDFYASILVDYFLKRRMSGCKVVYDAHELIIPEPQYPLGRKARLIYKLEKYAIRHSDCLICAKEERGQAMKEHYNLQTTPYVIRNISQLSINETALPEEMKVALEAFFKEPGITVVYAGAVMKKRRIDEIVQAVMKFPDKYKLLIVGDGDQLDELKGMTSGVSNLKSLMTGKVPYSALGYILSKCDIGFIYYPNTTINNRLCASNKLYEYASVNLPILANNNLTVQKEVEKYNIGVVTDDFEQGLDLLSKRLVECKANCKDFSAQNQWDDEADKLRNVINQL